MGSELVSVAVPVAACVVGAVSATAAQSGENFPESAGKIYIIGAPYGFETAWNIIKKLLDPRTASKIEIRGRVQDILEFIDAISWSLCKFKGVFFRLQQ